MSQYFTLAKDQRLHGKSNFTNWSRFIKTAAVRFGLEEYFDNDILNEISKKDYVIDLSLDNPYSNTITRVITDSAGNNPNNLLINVYNALVGITNGASSSKTSTPDNILLANNLINQAIYKNEVMRIIKQNDAQALLIILQNIDENIMTEVSRFSNCSQAFEKLKTMYGNANADMEFWIAKLKELKAKSRNQIIPVLDKVKQTFQEMNEAKVQITDKEKLKYMYNSIPHGTRKEISVTLETKPDDFYNSIKGRINALAYLENTNNEDENDDPMDVDFLSRERKRINDKRKLKEKNNISNKKHILFCKICRKHGHTLERCKFNGKINGKYKHKESNKNGNQQNYNNKNQQNKGRQGFSN